MSDPRTEGREFALFLLYREELTGLSDPSVPGIEDASEAAAQLAGLITGGVREHLEQIDASISDASEHWDIGRMGTVDRTILRIGVCELLFHPDTPAAVVINEAVEMARKYSSQECGRFVNGILDRIAKDGRSSTPTERS